MKFLTTKKLVLSAVAILLIIALVASGWLGRFIGTSRKKIDHIILITIDTCRADHLSSYGCPKPTTPNVDSVASHGVLFENAVSPIPLTLPAHASILTGTIPPYHGVRDNMEYKLGDSQLSLAEILAEDGFKTAAVISAFVLDSQFGLAQGFDYYNDKFEDQHAHLQISERRGEETTRLANAWLQENYDQPFFLFLHYFDPHTDYRPPPPFDSIFKDDPYAGEVAYADHCIGGVITRLKELGIYDSSLIIIAGDHGEGLGQHAEDEHSFFIYQSTVKVPLIIKPPNSKTPQRVKQQAGLIDIVPTILSMLDIDPPENLHGSDLTGLFGSGEPPPAQQTYYYCESLYPTKYDCNPLYGIVAGRYKYIWTTEPELYDLQQDPDETKNIALDQTQLARQMQNRLKHILATHASDQQDNIAQLDARTMARLESLGYIAGRIVDTDQIDPDKRDPKERIDYHRLSQQYHVCIENIQFARAAAICAELLEKYPELEQTYYMWGYAALNEGKIAEAVEKLTIYVNAYPENVKGQYRLGLALAAGNDHQKAADHFSNAVKLDPDDYTLHGNLGLSLNQLGKYDEAVKCFAEVLRLHPNDPDAHANMAISLALQNKLTEAIAQYEQALRLKPNEPAILINLGRALTQQGDLDEALVHWNTALKFTDPQSQDHRGLMVLMAQQLARHGRTQQAIEQTQQILKLDPDSFQLHHNLGLLYYKAGTIDRAIDHWNKTLKLKPDNAQTLNTLAWVLATSADENIRNSANAIELAQHACQLSGFTDPTFLDTLAAAYAAAAKFDRAAETAKKALSLIKEPDSATQFAENLKKRLALYQKGLPHLE